MLRSESYVHYLPAHSSHILQPLDASMFHQIKRDYRNMFENPFLELDQPVDNIARIGNSFISVVKSIQKNLTPVVVRNSFKMVGLSEGVHVNGRTFVRNDPNTDHVGKNTLNLNINDSLPTSDNFFDSRVRIGFD